MKRIMIVLPLAVLLAYCSGPNNTQTTTGTDMNGTSNSVSASTTGTTTDDVSTRSTDVSDVNTNSSTVNTQDGTNGNKADIVASSSNSTSNNNSTSNYGSISTTGTMNMDPSDPRNQHFQSVNGQNWTWDMNYPGYDRPTAGTYNSAINGNWQLVMTPELVSAWRQDNSLSLWSSGYAYDGRYLGGNTYLSASESFNTRNNGSMTSGTTGNLNNNNSGSNTTMGSSNTNGSLQVNGSTGAGTISSNNTSSSTSGLNNNASANSSVANQMNGSTSSSSTMNGSTGGSTIIGSTGNSSTTGGSVNGSTSGTISGNAGGSVNANSGTTGSSTLNGSSTTGSGSTLNSGSVNSSSDLSVSTSTSTNMDMNSINYNAANGNMYQLPKFNLYLDNGSFTGYTGCNSVSGRVAVTGSSLHFLNTTPSTNIDCLGGLDQNVFLDLLRRVDSYSYVGDELQLMQGNQVLLRFRKNNSGNSLQ